MGGTEGVGIKGYRARICVLAAAFAVLQLATPVLTYVGFVLLHMYRISGLEAVALDYGVPHASGYICTASVYSGMPPEQHRALVRITPTNLAFVAYVASDVLLARDDTTGTPWCYSGGWLMRLDTCEQILATNGLFYGGLGGLKAHGGRIYLNLSDMQHAEYYYAFVSNQWVGVSSNEVDWSPGTLVQAGETAYRFRTVDYYVEYQLGASGEWHRLESPVCTEALPFTFAGRAHVAYFPNSRHGKAEVWRIDGANATKVDVTGMPAVVSTVCVVPDSNGVIFAATSPDQSQVSWYTFDGRLFSLVGTFGKPFKPVNIPLLVTGGVGLLCLWSLLFALMSGRLAARQRSLEYVSEAGSGIFATPVRRGLAALIDGMLLLCAVYAVWHGAGWLIVVTRKFQMTPVVILMILIRMHTVVSGLCVTAIGYVLFSYLEGAYGWTPGKLACGIRVCGTDLKLCGFWRALLRNILRLVDGFLNYLVGVMVIAFTRNWQRVGDMAARTIVVRRFPQSSMS